MQPDYSRFWPWIFGALMVFAVYRRFRRNFGRQLLRPVRMKVRIGILLLLGAALTPAVLHGVDFALAEGIGAAAGVALALFGASRTRFARDGERLYYIPHTVTGVAVSALLLGRIVYRLAQFSQGGLGAAGGEAPSANATMMKSPLTLGLFFVLIGYYACYYGWVLWKSQRITAADLEASPTLSSSAPDPSLPG
jgi:hypothetical protein